MVVAHDAHRTLDEDAVTDAIELEASAAGRRRPSAPLETGERFRLGATIGKGGMGEVVAAQDLDIGRDVAIKRLRVPNPTPIALARFLREARIQGRLDHPAIVPVHEMGYDDDGRPFFAMKKLSGTTLAEILRARDAKVSRRELLRAFVDVCLAVEFAHTRGVIHRDLKPANILLGDFGEVYVLDWGIARVEGDREETAIDPADVVIDGATGVATAAGIVLGTRGYMAPEQARAERGLDGRVDVYALGCVLCEILGTSPAHEQCTQRIRVGHVVEAPAGRDDVPPELEAVCRRATQVDRRERIGSARELGEAVRRYLDGDRDLELRATLAREHLVVAEIVLLADGDNARRTAMREAGRALALDPSLVGAAELVGRLMIEPPRETPGAVASELTMIDHAATRRFGWNCIGTCIGFVAMAATFWAIGVRDVAYLGALVGLSVVAAMFGVLEVRTGGWTAAIWVSYLVSVVLFARMFTPFLIGPAVVVGNIMMFAFHPASFRGRLYRVVWIGSIVAILGTWAAELFGLVSPTMFVDDGRLVLAPPLDGIGALPIIESLAIATAMMIASSALLARGLSRAHLKQRERLHVQRWQLRQLVSRD